MHEYAIQIGLGVDEQLLVCICDYIKEVRIKCLSVPLEGFELRYKLFRSNFSLVLV